ncbi:carbohydrate kinase [Melanogaster broomeanus]|nr:carbohydrate kinase [Melanogaster broomeanus]
MASSGACPDISKTITDGQNHESRVQEATDVIDELRPHPAKKDLSGSRFIIVMGVSGTGKSTLAAALSKALHLPFIDGDDLHPPSNIEKMSRGEPLNDTDRQPWLETIRKTAIARILEQLGVDRGEHVETHEKPETDKTLTEYEQGIASQGSEPSPLRDEERRPGVIVACSALKRKYRNVLRGEAPTSSTEASRLDALSLPTYFVYLKGDRDVLMDRMQNRNGHFMKAGMLESQLNALESPEGESGVVTVPVELSTEDQVRRIVEVFRCRGR